MGLTSPYRVIEPLSDRLCRHFFTLSSSRIDFFATLAPLFRRLPPRRGNNNRGNIGINLSHTRARASYPRRVEIFGLIFQPCERIIGGYSRLEINGTPWSKKRGGKNWMAGWWMEERGGERERASTQRALRLERWRGVDGRRVANLDVN